MEDKINLNEKLIEQLDTFCPSINPWTGIESRMQIKDFVNRCIEAKQVNAKEMPLTIVICGLYAKYLENLEQSIENLNIEARNETTQQLNDLLDFLHKYNAKKALKGKIEALQRFYYPSNYEKYKFNQPIISFKINKSDMHEFEQDEEKLRRQFAQIYNVLFRERLSTLKKCSYLTPEEQKDEYLKEFYEDVFNA